MSLSKDLVNLIKKTQETKTSPYDTQAEVVRVEGQTAWVHIPGGVDETPVRMTINANVGDTVQVRVANGTAFLVGNGTAPPTDDHKANEAGLMADMARELAESAAAGVKGIVNYFWHDADGVHVSTAPGDFTSSGVKNVLVDSEGLDIRSGSALLAYFRSQAIRLGQTLNGYVEITPNSFVFQPNYGSSDFGYYRISGQQVTQTYIGDGSTQVFDLFRYSGSVSVTINGTSTTAFTTSLPQNDSLGSLRFNSAPAAGAVIEATYTTNWENPCYDFGINTVSAPYGHAEGRGNTVDGIFGHVEGRANSAGGAYSHAQNHGTKASGEAQTAMGKYNVEDTSNAYAVVVGNGSSASPSNAAALDWNGNLRIKGDIYAGCANDSTGGAIIPRTVVKQVAANGTTTINSQNARYTLTLIGGGSNYRGMYLVAGYSTSVETKAISSVASGVVSTSGANVVINNSESYAMIVIATVYVGSVSMS